MNFVVKKKWEKCPATLDSLTRVEVQVQERGETERGWSLESSRRLQSLESEVGRVQTLLEVVRDEATSIRVGQAELKAAVQSNPAKGSRRKYQLNSIASFNYITDI